MKSGFLAALLVFALTAAIASTGAAGPISQGSGSYSIFAWDDAVPEPHLVVDVFQFFEVTGALQIPVDSLGAVEGAALIRIDPDPRAAYEFTLHNTTSGLLQGVVVVDFDIAPIGGGLPSRSRLEVTYDDPGGEGIDSFVQHLTYLLEQDAPHETFFNELTLSRTITSEEPAILASGPIPLPEPKKAPYNQLGVQLSFYMEAGDSAVFQGSTLLPEPQASVLLGSALAALALLARGHRTGTPRS